MVTAKEYLNRLIELDKEIKRKRMRIQTLRSVATSTSAKVNSDAVQETKDVCQLENIMLEIVDLENEIKNDESTLSEIKKDLWEKLEKLDDERHKRILWLHYAERKSWSEIAADFQLSRRHAIRIHTVSLIAFEMLFQKNLNLSKMSPDVILQSLPQV